MANPIADSAAAMDKTNKANIWPKRSSKYTENTTKLRLIDNKINSTDIKTIKIFFLFKTNPKTPIVKSIVLTVK